MTVLYFGCHDQAGHCLRVPGMLRVFGSRPPLPWEDHELDAALCPGVTFRKGHMWPPDEQPEGLGLIHHKDGWTAWAFWDRSVDKRGNCNSVFLAKGEHDFEAMKDLAREYFPEVWERLEFDLSLHTESEMKDAAAS